MSMIPPRRDRIYTGNRSKRVVVGITAEQHAEAQALAGGQNFTLASFLYLLIEEGLEARRPAGVNETGRGAEEEG